MTSSIFRRTVLTVAICAGLSACGGGDSQSAGIGGSGNGPDGTQTAGVVGSGGGPRVASVGTITGFGSVFVNGVEYFTSDDVEDDSFTTRYEVDGVIVTDQNDLRIGMVVRLNGELDKNTETGEVLQTSGRALSVAYDDDVEGPVANITSYVLDLTTSREFTVLGTTVRAEDGLTVFDDRRADRTATDPAFNFASLDNNDVVEVSGFVGGDGVLLASRIERKSIVSSGSGDPVAVEVKSTVAAIASSTRFELANGLFVNYSSDVLDDDLVAINIDDLLEVKGILSADGSEIDATSIEAESESVFEDTEGEDKVSIEGLVSALNVVVAGTSTFSIDGQEVTYDSNTLFEPTSLRDDLADGIKVEAEGPIVAGKLQASKIEARSGSIEIETLVESVDTTARTITLRFAGQDIVVHTDNRTVIRDDDDLPLLLSLIASGDFLEIDAFAGSGGNLMATVVKREVLDQDDTVEPELRAPLADNGLSFDAGSSAGSITLRLDGEPITIVVNTDAGTEFERVDGSKYDLAADFFNAYPVEFSDGDLIKIELGSDGIAREVELESSASSDDGVSSSSSASSDDGVSSSSSSSSDVGVSSSSSSSSDDGVSSSSSSSTPSSSSSSSTPSSSSSSSTPSSSSSSTTTPDGVPDLSGDGTPED